MKRDFTKRNTRMVFRFGYDENKGNGGDHAPLFNGMLGGKTPEFALPLPSNPVLGSGNSRAITAADGNGGAFDHWMDPASPVCKPNGKRYTK